MKEKWVGSLSLSLSLSLCHKNKNVCHFWYIVIDFFFMKAFSSYNATFPLLFFYSISRDWMSISDWMSVHLHTRYQRDREREREASDKSNGSQAYFVIRVRVSDAATLFLRSQFIPRGIPWLSVIIIIILIFGEFVLDLNLNLPQTLSNPSPLASKAIPFPFYHVIVHIPLTSSAWQWWIFNPCSIIRKIWTIKIQVYTIFTLTYITIMEVEACGH